MPQNDHANEESEDNANGSTDRGNHHADTSIRRLRADAANAIEACGNVHRRHLAADCDLTSDSHAGSADGHTAADRHAIAHGHTGSTHRHTDPAHCHAGAAGHSAGIR